MPHRILASALCLCLAAFSCSGGTTPIRKLTDDPRSYEGKRVTITGQVQDRASLFLVNYFTIKDGTGEIKVVTQRALPAVGSTQKISGKVEQAFAVGPQQLVVFMEEPAGTR